jgi:hypothetical protein
MLTTRPPKPLIKVKESGTYIKDGASRINVSVYNKAQK